MVVIPYPRSKMYLSFTSSETRADEQWPKMNRSTF